MKRFVLKKVREGKLDQWRDWCIQLATSRRAEAIESLADEHVLQEMCILFMVEGTPYVLGYMESDSREEILASLVDKEINIEHRKQLKECLEGKYLQEELYNIKQE